MKNIKIAFCLLSLFPLFSFAQGEKDWWYFGLNVGLHFVGNTPIPQFDGQINTNEGCSTISDANGNLLFYTDGITVWTKNHSIMPNGTGLLGDPSSTMSSMCIPLPGSPNLYYIFTTPAKAQGGLYYSVVDLNLNNGLGSIVVGKKNIQLLAKTCEKVTAVKNGTNTAYWVLAHGFPGNEYYAYQLTTNGLNSSPVISTVGVPISATNAVETIGYMKFSPLGNKLAVAHSNISTGVVEIFDFNAFTGELSMPIQFTNGVIPKPYGVEFSANGQYLYISTNNTPCQVFQIDMFAPTAAAIIASNTLIFTNQNTNSLGSLQIGPDNKIYVAVKNGNSLDVINQPELAGTACNYQINAVNIITDSYFSLPNFVQGLFIPPNLSGNQACIGENAQLLGAVIPNATLYQWQGPNAFFSGQINAIIANVNASDAGDYYFSALDINGNELFKDTVTLSVYPTYQYIIQDTFCKGSTYLLPGGSNTSEGGTYTFTFSSIYGCDSIVITHLYMRPAPTLTLGSDKQICERDSITFTAPNGFLAYSWNGNPALNQTTFTTKALGTYWVNVQDVAGCWGGDSITLNGFYPAPQGFLPKDSSLCEDGESITLKITGFLSYLWGNGSTSNTFIIQDTGTYQLRVENTFHCFGKAEIHVREACPLEIYFPNAFSPNQDGINDVFLVSGKGIDFLEMYIFDAWGHLMKTLHSPQETWDGTSKGKFAPEGVYTYKAKARSNLGQSIERGGTITLIR